MRVLGIDPGLTRAGWGVVEEMGGRLRPVEHGTIRAGGEDAPAQLAALRGRLADVIARTRPEEMAIERLFVTRNQRTAIRVGQASGVILLAAAEAGMPVSEYGPLQVKQAVVGVGNASKDQVAFMVRRLLGLSEKPDTADAADALALAITHLHSYRLAARAAR
ncbi:MAG: crossover junction endodeoxyribonuclease RuvC [Actinobacteria bacterium]|nr:crossover junction endodeoxyribonuclease RuvC [Actinomycetota bacterium]